MKRKIIIVLLAIIFLSAPALAKDQIKIYDRNWRLQYRVYNGKIYDQDWRLKGRIQGNKVYDRDWRLRYRIQRPGPRGKQRIQKKATQGLVPPSGL